MGCLAPLVIGFAMFVTLYKFAPHTYEISFLWISIPEAAFDAGVMGVVWTGGWAALMVLVKALNDSVPAPLRRIPRLEPLQRFEFETKHNQGRTVSRTALTISSQDMFELRKIAGLWQIGEPFTFRAFKAEGLSLSKWRPKMLKDGWITMNSKNEVVVLPRGRIKFRNILEGEKPPTQSVDGA